MAKKSGVAVEKPIGGTAQVCKFCAASLAVARIPSGWHRVDDGVVCKTCWKDRYVLRAITFPIVGPVDAEWADFRKALAVAWSESTCLANWAVTELAKADVVRMPGDEKMKPMPPVYLYGLAGKKYSGWGNWSGAYSAAQSLMRAVEQKYRKRRLEVVWRHEASLPTHKYPVPYPVHNASWEAFYGKDNVPLVSFPMAGQRWTVRLKGGAEMAQQLGDFAKIVKGAGIQGELAIYRVNANGNDNRNGITENGSGGGQKQHHRVMAKLVAWLPRPPKREASATMFIHTDPNAFWVAEMDGRAPWIVNADHVRRWVAEHRVYLQRISEDTKREKRWPKQQREQINEAREKRCQKQNARLDTWCHQVTAMVTQFATRNGVAEVVYDDSIKSYVESFPWFKLSSMLGYKMNGQGITCKGTKAKDADAEPEGE